MAKKRGDERIKNIQREGRGRYGLDLMRGGDSLWSKRAQTKNKDTYIDIKRQNGEQKAEQ